MASCDQLTRLRGLLYRAHPLYKLSTREQKVIFEATVQRNMATNLLYAWCLFTFTSGVVEVLSHLGPPHSPVLYILCLGLSLVALLVAVTVKCVPRVRTYAALLLFAGLLLSDAWNQLVMLGWLKGWFQNSDTEVHFRSDPSYGIPHLYKQVERDPVLFGELNGFIRYRDALQAVLFRCLVSLLPHIAISSLVFGTSWLSFASNCLAILIHGSASVYLEVVAPAELCCYGFLLVIVSTVIGFHVTSNRRKLFASEYRFRTALEASIAASVRADSILNHTLKNRMVECRDLLEFTRTFLASCARCAQECESLGHAGDILQQGIKNCRDRQLYLQLSKDSYVPCIRPVDLRSFCTKLCVGRQVTIDVPQITVNLEEFLCGLILDNAISNAIKHGSGTDQDTGVRLRVTQSARIRSADPHTYTVEPTPTDQLVLTFTISNPAAPGKPGITVDFVRSILNGVRHAGADALSDQIGLQHCFLAGRALGCTPRLQQVGAEVTFDFQLTVEQVSNTAEALVADLGVTDLTANTDLPLTDLTATPVGNGSFSAEHPRVCCIDDNALARKMLARLFTTQLGPHLVRTFGDTKDQCTAFLEATLEWADVAILDQNLDYPTGTVYGTDLVQVLRERGFGGLIAIRSANNADDDVARYTRSGAHCILPKDLVMTAMLKKMLAEYRRHRSVQVIDLDSTGHPHVPVP